MPRKQKDEQPAVRVYTVCDESRYLIIKNVPALGCGDDILKLFQTYGEIEDFKPMDEEDCEPFTDVYWIKFLQISNARFAKRKLDEFVFLGNKLQVSYAPHFESLSDTKQKLECRSREVLARLNSGKFKESSHCNQLVSKRTNFKREYTELNHAYGKEDPPITRVSSNKEYFPSPSMNKTVNLVREKLDKIQSSSNHIEDKHASKKVRVDNRRRI
ncbi:Rna-binding protein [Thalictrum thalictroides]|uniref:RNA-binding protein 48 n=1 Tax=Thalictrum thalictroides TaxID=46969 RepID=A0A7J6USY3_THATH|nr:Rna-binding protein [Thalictrum thalictroides]